MINRFKPFIAALALLGAGSLPAVAMGQTFALDPYHTEINLSWNHFGFSNPGATFNLSEGTLVWDADAPENSSIAVTISADSAHTRAAVLMELFKTQYFAVEQYPAITFKGSSFERIGLSRHYRVPGELTIRDISKPVVLEAVLNNIGEHGMLQAPAIGFEATATVRRSEFGLDDFLPFVSDEVQVRITGEGLEPAALAKLVEMVETGVMP